MTINASCSCGKTFRVKDELAGKRVKCSACGQPFMVPANSSTPSATPSTATVVPCSCGAQFRLTAKIAGKKVRCPKCKSICQMPAMSAAAGSVTTQAVVAAVAEPIDEDFWTGVGQPQATTTEEGEQVEAPASPADDMSHSQAAGYVIRQIHDGQSFEDIELDLIAKGMKPWDAERLLETLTDASKTGAKSAGESGIGFLLFAWSGCIPRSQYWLGVLILAGLRGIEIPVIMTVAMASLMSEDTMTRVIAVSIILAVELFFLFMGIAVTIKRLHDLDMDGWWLVYPLIPVAGQLVCLYLFIKCGFVKGFT